MSLYIIGGVRARLEPFNISAAGERHAMEFAKHDVIDARPIHERTREAARDLRLSGEVFPRAIGGRAEIALLSFLLDRGNPVLVMRGGTLLGWHVLTELRTDHEWLDPSGFGRKVRVALTIERTQRGGILETATDFARLFGA